MPLLLGQLIYTTFPGVGFKVFASTQVTPEIQQAFIQQVAHRYWDAYDPPKPGYRAAYLHQLSADQTLFGWLYNNGGGDDLARGQFPYFVCYYLAVLLRAAHLDVICHCLERGPLELIDRENIPEVLENVIVPDSCSYQPADRGVKIPSRFREHSHTLLSQARLIDVFVPVSPDQVAGVIADKPPSIAATPINSQVTALAPTQKKAAQPQLPATRVALLVGMSNYGAGFNALPGAERDLVGLQQFLAHPEMGGFSEVKTLLNPSWQLLSAALEQLFQNRQAEDLVLFYFSGHGVRDNYGKACLTTFASRRDVKKQVDSSTVITSEHLSRILNDCRSLHQILIFDCCWSEAYPRGESLWTNALVNIEPFLGGQGRVVLMSSAATHASFAQKGAELSAYTTYLVEGLVSGAADLDGDGMISVLELHEYVRGKLQLAIPAMQPKVFGTRTILIATPPSLDPKLKYRKEVERSVDREGISAINRIILNTLRENLGLTAEETGLVEAEVLKPHLEYQNKVKEYALAFVESIQEEYPLSEESRHRFKHFQEILGLTDADTDPIESHIIQRIKLIQAPYHLAEPSEPGRSSLTRPPSTSTPPKSKIRWLWLSVGISGVLLLGVIVFLLWKQQNQNTQPSSTTSALLCWVSA
jgi:uncharacterized caspase-like protein